MAAESVCIMSVRLMVHCHYRRPTQCRCSSHDKVTSGDPGPLNTQSLADVLSGALWATPVSCCSLRCPWQYHLIESRRGLRNGDGSKESYEREHPKRESEQT